MVRGDDVGPAHGNAGDARQGDVPATARHNDDGAGSSAARRPRARWARGTAVLLITGGLSLASVGAFAQLVPVPDDRPGYLQLTAAPYPAGGTDLSPGQSVSWHLDARLADADSSTLGLQLRGAGALVEHLQGMEVSVESCPSAFTGDRCLDGGTTVVPRARLAEVTGAPSGDTWWLPDLVHAEPQHLRVELGLPAEGSGDASLQELEGMVTVGLHATGSDPVVPGTPGEPDVPATASPGTPTGPGRLPSTGLDVTGLLLAAAGAVLLGAALRRGVRAPR